MQHLKGTWDRASIRCWVPWAAAGTPKSLEHLLLISNKLPLLLYGPKGGICFLFWGKSKDGGPVMQLLLFLFCLWRREGRHWLHHCQTVYLLTCWISIHLFADSSTIARWHWLLLPPPHGQPSHGWPASFSLTWTASYFPPFLYWHWLGLLAGHRWAVLCCPPPSRLLLDTCSTTRSSDNQ